MKAKTEQTVTLSLTKEEALWLQGVMQNPLWGQTPEEEDAYTRNMRWEFFHTLDTENL